MCIDNTSAPAYNYLKNLAVKNIGLISSTMPLVDIKVASHKGKSTF